MFVIYELLIVAILFLRSYNCILNVHISVVVTHSILLTVIIGGKMFQFLQNLIGYTQLILLVMATQTNQILAILELITSIHSRRGPPS